MSYKAFLKKKKKKKQIATNCVNGTFSQVPNTARILMWKMCLHVFLSNSF